MVSTSALVVAHVKCVPMDLEDEWNRWYDEVHLPDLLDPGDTAHLATRWRLEHPPTPGLPGLGFSHVTIFEFDSLAAISRLEGHAARLREQSRIHPAHCVTGAAAWTVHGRSPEGSSPSPEVVGLIVAEVMVANPADEETWDEWYDAQHLPDMLATGAFVSGSRWQRSPRRVFGPNHLTIYEVGPPDLQTAVERSASAMPRLVAEGRKFSGHTGVLTLRLAPTGAHGASGYRPDTPPVIG